jgi:hypothetical protein
MLIYKDSNPEDGAYFYDPSKKRSHNEDAEWMSRDEMNRQVAERLKKYKDYEDFLKNYKDHKIKHATRTKLRSQGFEEAKRKYGYDYDHYRMVKEEYKDKYYCYKEGTHKEYFDTKENHEYYSKPLLERMRIQAKPAFKRMFTDLFHSHKDSDNEDPRPAA